MNQKNLEVLTNVIGAVESGSQVYGKRRYNMYSPPYHSTPKEHTCTLGWACCYGHEGQQLIQNIKNADLVTFFRCDPDGIIDNMLLHDWESLRWKPNSKEKAILIALIDSPVGHKVQDEMFISKMKKLVSDCEADYPKADVKAQMMYCEIRHLGGRKPVNRIFDRCNGKFDLDTIMASLVRDQKDTSNNNQVGDKLFWSRHVKCRQFIDQYAVDEDAKPKEVTKVTEKDIILCGHGSGTPRTIRMDTYLSNRYAQKAPNGKRKGVVAVRRYKKFTDSGRQKFHDKYSTILGRNIYSQSLRKYCYKRYKDDRYYSDCSSSVCLTLKEIGYDMDALNTAGIYTDSRFEDVPVKIKDGHILNPEVLKVGDFLEFVGSDPDRPKQIGHVEAIYAIKGDEPDPDPEPSLSDRVKTLQEFLNINYKHILRAAGTGQLVVDGEYGRLTRNATLAVWKYMANKYYDADLTLDNHNFYGACKVAAEKMTDSEIKKHYTLQEILNGLLAGHGYRTLLEFQRAKNIGSGKMNAHTWHMLFNL